MATDGQATATAASAQGVRVASPPPLENGDRLSRDEFERRYLAMPQLKKAELIEGVAYVMSSPVSTSHHGAPHADLIAWLGRYRAETPGVQAADNATIRLDDENEPQPDIYLRVLPGFGGQTRDDGRYIAGAPELCCEVASTSAAYDLHDKKEAFRRNGVREYLVWRTEETAIDWFRLRDGEYVKLAPEAGVLKSEVFPGLWLDRQRLLEGDLRGVLTALDQGLQAAEHRKFVAELHAASQAGSP